MSMLVKSILATVFLGSGIVAVLCMLTLMGKSERKLSGTALRRLHKTFGFIFLVLLLVISHFCLRLVKMGGDSLSLRAVFHSVIALSLFIVLILKIVVVQFYKEFMRFAPGMGMIVLVLAFLAYGTSAGYFFLVSTGPVAGEATPATATALTIVQKGKTVFERQCSFCHFADKAEPKLGPGLEGVLKREELPASGRPATLENVRGQLVNPFRSMPSFKSTLSEEEMKTLLAYLQTI